MKITTQEKIVKYIREKRSVSPKDIAENIGITRQALFKHIPKLIARGVIKKIGRSPKVFYHVIENDKGQLNIQEVGASIKKTINDRYLYVTPQGEMLSGWDGFSVWSQKTHQDLIKTASEYISTLKRYDSFRKDGIIDGTKKMKETFQDFSLDVVYYIDFYSIERFGKTKLGQMLLYAKQSQDKKMISEITNITRVEAIKLIKKYRIDGILFVPPTVKREVQFMKDLERNFNIPLRSIAVSKIKTPVIIPQKTLNKLNDRIENARGTIMVEDNNIFKNILIIDDAVGSGATLNEVAKKIRQKGICKGKIIGLAITGSFKEFDVISEV